MSILDLFKRKHEASSSAEFDFSAVKETFIENGARFSRVNAETVVPELCRASQEVVNSLICFQEQDKISNENLGVQLSREAYEAGILAVAYWGQDPRTMMMLGIPQSIMSFGYGHERHRIALTLGFYKNTFPGLKNAYCKLADKIEINANGGNHSLMKMMDICYRLGLQAALPMLGDQYNP